MARRQMRSTKQGLTRTRPYQTRPYQTRSYQKIELVRARIKERQVQNSRRKESTLYSRWLTAYRSSIVTRRAIEYLWQAASLLYHPTCVRFYTLRIHPLLRITVLFLHFLTPQDLPARQAALPHQLSCSQQSSFLFSSLQLFI